MVSRLVQPFFALVGGLLDALLCLHVDSETGVAERVLSCISTTAHVRQPSQAEIGELSKIKRERGILFLLAAKLP